MVISYGKKLKNIFVKYQFKYDEKNEKLLSPAKDILVPQVCVKINMIFILD